MHKSGDSEQKIEFLEVPSEAKITRAVDFGFL